MLLILVCIVVIPALVLMLVFGAEFLLLLLLLPFVLLGRMLFGLPWIVVVRVGGKVVGEHPAVGWAGSAELISRIAGQFDSRGVYPR
ncbi:hypothetical protein [Jongsikchunia kroppenstedtii]|uniref:hypothetical protein n=1 Tax=Jongsikchunia kroppenstedtii TaxID=1121721 RepID=UPI00035C663F|nr:hypothetical protein [Jongsikchunia kroppenstedtii]